METVVILSLTVALAAGVVWWVTSGQIPTFFTGRRGGRPTTPPFTEGNPTTGSSTVTRGWPRTPPEPARRRTGEARGGVMRHRASRSTFTYATPARDQRPPVPLTILKIIFFVSLVSALLAGGIWAVGQFLTSFMTRLIGE